MLALRTPAFRTILTDYRSKIPPQMYASVEAETFSRYLVSLDMKVPHLAKILEFENAAMSTIKDGVARIIHFEIEPLPLLRALAEKRLPEEAGTAGNFEIELTADNLIGSAQSESDAHQMFLIIDPKF